MAVQTTDAHLVLGVPQCPSYEQIQKAYRSRVRMVHPDCGGSTEQFDRLHKAYEQLRSELRSHRQGRRSYSSQSAPPARQTPPEAASNASTPSRTFSDSQARTEPSSNFTPDPRIPEILRLMRLKMKYEAARKAAEEKRQAEETAFLARFGLTPQR